jgi:hypothetical protein
MRTYLTPLWPPNSKHACQRSRLRAALPHNPLGRLADF